MFAECSELKRIKLPHGNYSALADADRMFAGCEKLERIECSGGISADYCNAEVVLARCSNLRFADLRFLGPIYVSPDNLPEEFRGIVITDTRSEVHRAYDLIEKDYISQSEIDMMVKKIEFMRNNTEARGLVIKAPWVE